MSGQDVYLRFRVLNHRTGEVLSDENVTYVQADEAANRQGDVAFAALERGVAVELLVTDPDEDDQVMLRAVWTPAR